MTLRPQAIRGLIREEKYDAKKFMIERDIPTLGKSMSEQLRAASKQSVRALKQVGPDVQWVQSYLTDDKLSASIWLPTKPRFVSMQGSAALRRPRSLRFDRQIDPISAE